MHQLWHMRSSMFVTKLLHSQNSHVGHSILIHGSTQIRHVELNWINCRSFHVLNPLSPNIHKQILQTDLYTFL